MESFLVLMTGFQLFHLNILIFNFFLTTKPVICSMGNYAASGGYYVASNCHRIFALPSTVTGSIGVFAIKLDLTDFASRYGVNVEHVVTGSHSTMYSPFQPLTRKSNETMSRNVAQCYEWFKAVVSIGRGKSMREVEKVAQGRVWTGIQAMDNGLVDEMGGLDRAIGYAQRNFTVSGKADIDVWPKRTPLSVTGGAEVLQELFAPTESKHVSFMDFLSPDGLLWLLESSVDPVAATPELDSGTMMTIDENVALKVMLQDSAGRGKR